MHLLTFFSFSSSAAYLKIVFLLNENHFLRLKQAIFMIVVDNSQLELSTVAFLLAFPDVQKGGRNAWYTLFAHALNFLLGNSIMDISDVDVWAGFC